MPKVTINDEKGLVQAAGSGLTVKSTSTFTGALTANSLSNDIALSMRAVIGEKVTLATGTELTTSDAVVQPAFTVLMGVGMMCTTAITFSGGINLGLNVGTDADGTDASIVALDATSIGASSAAPMAQNAFLTSFYGGPSASAGTAAVDLGLSLKADAPVFTPVDRNLYFRTTSSSGGASTGKYKPILFVMRLA